MDIRNMGEEVVEYSDRSPETLCRYFLRPFPECHCKEITSLSIPFVLKYCNGNQLTCDIYLRNSEKD